MKLGSQAYRLTVPALVVLAAALLSCGRLSPRSAMTQNQPPEISLDVPSFGPEGPTFTWRAHDPDGRIDHYVYALNPPSVDRVGSSWSRTDQARAAIHFPRAAVLGRVVKPGKEISGPQIFAVRAVDDRGAESAPATLAVFDSSEIAPTVVIDSPSPNQVFTPIVPPSFEVRWHGQDLDGRITGYKFRLFGPKNPDFPNIPNFVALLTSNPDTLNALYGPDFASWDEAHANVTSTTYSDVLTEVYAFAITALDDDGHYDPVFSTSKNVLRIAVSDNAAYGSPLFCVSSSLFNICSEYTTDLDLSYEIPTSPLAVNWYAVPVEGSTIDGYRWTLDPRDTTDLDKGFNHWTRWKLSNTSATVGPFTGGTQHTLYVQARDNFDRISTLRLQLTTVGTTPTRELLVVDDTRLTPDQFNASTGTWDPPRGTWPTAAELDTFLYARGGFPWKGYPGNPQGPPAPTPTLSTPGILSGYDFDTVGTRGNPSGIVPLSLLSQYRQVMWFTDDVGATYTGSPLELLAPITSLRLMNQPGQYNSLSAYVAQGGKLWLSGGGAAYATLIAWGRRNTPPNDWTNADGELIAGRFMYDYSHWRSAAGIAPARLALVNTPAWSPWPNAAPGRGWSGHGIDRTLSQPNYARLGDIQLLTGRTCTSDPAPPQRFCNFFFFGFPYPAEFIGRVAPNASPPNFVQEDADPHPVKARLESTLDTLYTAHGGSLPSQLPVMTYYHGFESGPVVFSGFPLWYFQRAQVQKLVDFVLQDIWGLTKQSTSTAAVASRRR